MTPTECEICHEMFDREKLVDCQVCGVSVCESCSDDCDPPWCDRCTKEYEDSFPKVNSMGISYPPGPRRNIYIFG